MIEIPRVAEFKKVTFEQFEKDWIDNFGDNEFYGVSARESYCGLDIPARSTSGSAGYDFVSPINFVLYPGDDIKIPTGIRCVLEAGNVLMIYPRSSLGFKYKMSLANSCGIIDSDYANSDNEGHIFMKIVNNGDKLINIKRGDKFVQGIIIPFCITYSDDVDAVRNGGMGSTGR